METRKGRWRDEEIGRIGMMRDREGEKGRGRDSNNEG
jgi:hypothetical protein